MAPTQTLQRALKQQDYIKIIELAVKSHINKRYLLALEDGAFWKRISRHCYGRTQFIDTFCNKLDWKLVSTSPLTIGMANRFKSYLIWPIVSQQKYLSKNFILTFGNLLDLQIICKNYNNLSLAVQQKYAHALNWQLVVSSHIMVKEWFRLPIRQYIDYEYVSKSKHLNAALLSDPSCMENINLSVYMQNESNISDALILYCLREGRVQELKTFAERIPWSNHMLVFDEYPALATTLHDDWGCIGQWTGSNAPPAYYIKHMLAQDFVNNLTDQYWQKLCNYTVITNVRASAAFNLMLFQNFKHSVDWKELLYCNQFLNLSVLYRKPPSHVEMQKVLNMDEDTLCKAFAQYFKLNPDDCDNANVIPLHMSVKDAYKHMTLIKVCASQHEHDTAETCNSIFKLNGGEDGLLNWSLLSATQPVCPFNLRHLHNVNAITYQNKNNNYVQTVYEQMVAIQNDSDKSQFA